MKIALASRLPAVFRLLACCLFATVSVIADAQDPDKGFIEIPRSTDSTRLSLITLTSGLPASLRGLSVVDDRVLWVSGSGGTVGKSTDGGKTWEWMTVPGYEKRDFRDIEAFDSKTAVIMAIAEPADILKTTDGGKTWKLVYENKRPGMFLDAMEFWDKSSGIVVGDPVGGRFFLAQSFDGGDSWHDVPARALPRADSGEGCFASSGTNIRNLKSKKACFVSGGPVARLFIGDTAITLPILQGKASTGANSVAVRDPHGRNGGRHLIVVGGDFARDTLSEKNCFLTDDGGKTWHAPATPPHGYRSCVEFFGEGWVLTCGTSGVDVSLDSGMTWRLLTGTGFHVCRKAKNGKAVFLAGAHGKIARLSVE